MFLRFLQSVASVSLAMSAPVAAATMQVAPNPPGAALVASAADALGTDRARAAAASFRAEQRGIYHAIEQARSPAEPEAQAGRVFRWRFDGARGRLIREAEQLFAGGIRFSTRTALSAGGGWTVDLLRWRTGDDLDPIEAEEALRPRLQWERYFPHLLLRQAEAAQKVEAVGRHGFRFTDPAGDTIEVTLDPATMRPLRAAQTGQGAPPTQYLYSDYTRRHGIMMPQRLQLLQNGRLVEDVRLGATALDRLTDNAMRPPAGYVAQPPAGEPTLRALAPDVLFFDNMPYHSMAVDMGDHLVLFEAPLNPGYAATQRRLLEQARPGKPVRYVLVTHHHGDHNGGLLPWVEAGATLVVPAGARVAIERQLRARGYRGEIKIEEVADRRRFGSGPSQVDAYVFASSHAEGHLFMHLPAHKLLFQGDLFYLPERGAPPAAFPVVRELEREIARRGLAVETVAGVHGRPASMEEFRRSLRLGRR